MSEALPARPHLDWLRNASKDRLDELRPANPDAKLTDAQLDVARKYGFPSWRALKEHVDSVTLTAATDTARLEEVKKAFLTALNRGNVDDVRALLDAVPQAHDLVNAPIGDFGARPVFGVKSNRALVDLLLEYGADLNLKSDWWAGPWGILDDADDETAKFLIERGVVVDIFAAAHLGMLDRVRDLLDADANLVNAKGGDGCRPLHFARNAEVMELLLARGADIDARCVDHESTAIQWAVPRPPGIEGTRPAEWLSRGIRKTRWLADHGAAIDIFIVAVLNDADLLNRAIAEYPDALSARCGEAGYPPCPQAHGQHIYVYTLGVGKTPAQVAAEFRSDRVLQDITERSTPLQRFMIACISGDAASARTIVDRDPALIGRLTQAEHRQLADSAWAGNSNAVKLMLDLGFDPLAPGNDSGTALHCAAWQGFADTVATIIDHPRVRDRLPDVVNAVEATHKSTPLGWCCHGSKHCRNPRGDYPRVARLLLNAGAISAAHNLNDASNEVRKVIEARSTMSDSTNPVRKEGGKVQIDGVPPLAWGKSGDTTYCGALSAALKPMGIDRSFMTLMGDSGLAFRIRWWRNQDGPGWCPSSPVGEMHPTFYRAATSVGVSLRSHVHLDGKTDMSTYAGEVMQSLEAGRPVLVYGNNMDCAVIFACEDEGRTVHIRDYFKGDQPLVMQLKDTKGFLCFITLNPPEPDEKTRAHHAIGYAVEDWRQERVPLHRPQGYGPYHFGDDAFSVWINDLRNAHTLAPDVRPKMFHPSWWTFTVLSDARLNAANYLDVVAKHFDESQQKFVVEAANHYRQTQKLASRTYTQRDVFLGPWTGKKIDDWTAEVQNREADLLEEMRASDGKAMKCLEQIVAQR